MFRLVLSVVHASREAIFALFVASAAFLNISPESQAGFVHRWLHWMFETTELWHIIMSVIALALFVISLVYAGWKLRFALGTVFKDIWLEHKSHAQKEK